MNKEQTQAVLQVLLGALLAVAISAGTFFLLRPAPAVVSEPSFGAQALAGGDATNFSAVEIDTNSSTLEGLDVDQTGSADIVVFRDGGTAVWTLADGGAVTSGGQDLNGNELTLDADADTSITADTDDQIDIEIGGSDIISATAVGLFLSGSTIAWDADEDTTSVASFDDVITYTLGAATGRIDILTGNLKVGNGTPGTTQNGEDVYIEDGLEVDGVARLDGTVNAAVDVDIGTFLNLSAQAAISLTEGAIITPTGSLQPLTSAAAVTTSTTTPIAATGEAGDLLILRNDNASDVIIIDGTGGTVECKADISLGAKDTVTLVLDTSAWHCLANYDNS